MLDSLQMPLIHYNNDFLSARWVDLREKFFVFHVYENALQWREESRGCCSVPIDQVLVHALFGEGCRSHKV